MRFFVTEYSTEKELFDSLENGVEDKIWLFECGEGTDFTIVDFLEKEVPYIGVGVKMPKSRDYEKFMDCLRNNITGIGIDDVDDSDRYDRFHDSECPFQVEDVEVEVEIVRLDLSDHINLFKPNSFVFAYPTSLLKKKKNLPPSPPFLDPPLEEQ